MPIGHVLRHRRRATEATLIIHISLHNPRVLVDFMLHEGSIGPWISDQKVGAPAEYFLEEYTPRHWDAHCGITEHAEYLAEDTSVRIAISYDAYESGGFGLVGIAIGRVRSGHD